MDKSMSGSNGENLEKRDAFLDGGNSPPMNVWFPELLAGEFIELRLMGKDLPTIQRYYESDPRSIVAAVQNLLIQFPKYDFYFGVCPRSKKEGNKEAIKKVWSLWVDLDGKDFKRGKPEALEILEKFSLSPTILVDSGHGYHAYWVLKEAVEINSDSDVEKTEGYLKALCKELNGDPSVCELARVMRLPGTENRKNPEQPVPVQLLGVYSERRYSLSDFDSFLTEEKKPAAVQRNEPGWVAKALRGLKESKHRNTDFSKIIGRFIHDDWTREDIFNLLRPHAAECGFSEGELQQEIEKMHRKYSESKPKQERKEKEEEKAQLSAGFDGLVDLVEHEGSPSFLIKKEDQLVIVPRVERDGGNYLPPPKDKIPWLLPRAQEVLRHYKEQCAQSSEADAKLFDDLRAYHKAISEFPSEEHYDLIAAWDIHTYCLEAVQYSPIICLFAVPERGKSRTGKGMIYVAYRGMHVESLRESNILREANDLQASIFFDVMDIWKKAEKNGSEDILLHRYEKGATVSRVLYPEKGPFNDTVYYKVFGPTVIATNQGVHKILETRAVQINMPETDRQFENDVRPELALPLKERLIAFRARHLGESFPDIPKPAQGRLGDIMKPLQQVIQLVRPEREKVFIQFVHLLENDRLIEKSDSDEAEIVKTIGRYDGKEGKIAVMWITDDFNDGKPEREKYSVKKIGWRLKAMGFKKERMNDGKAGIKWDEKLLERMSIKYGLRETSKTSETSVGSLDRTEVSEDTEVSRNGSGKKGNSDEQIEQKK